VLFSKSIVRLFLLFSCLVFVAEVTAQKYTAERGQVSFFSDAAIEDIEAVNMVVGSLFNAATGDIVFIMKIRDFVFDKSLMREHFNEKYLESEKYPKSTFQGKVVGFKQGVSGVQNVKAVGKLTIHGVTKDVEIPGIAELAGGKLLVKCKFIIKVADYNVKIPTLMWQNIAEQVEVKIDFIYKPV
jgi:hypothetical protein